VDVGEPRAQVVLVNVPVPSELKLTMPEGADFEPPSVSVTVAVQELVAFKATEAGEQLTLVDVVRLVTVTSA
jgi:hypothetical protein